MNKVIILLIMLILCLNTESQAQSAWVLWEKSEVTTESGRLMDTSWRLIAAYPSYESCVSRIEPMAEFHGKMWKEEGDEILDFMAKRRDVKGPKLYAERVTVVGGMWTVKISDRKGFSCLRTFSLQCFPESVDPRK